MCRDSLLDPAESKGNASRTWSLISSWQRRGRGKKKYAWVCWGMTVLLTK